MNNGPPDVRTIGRLRMASFVLFGRVVSMLRHRASWIVPVLALLVAATTVTCGGSGQTSTTTSPSPTIASPTASETFAGTLAVGGTSFYSFGVAQNGTVNVTLSSISGAFVPSTVTVGLGLGTPSGTTCSTSTSINAQAGSTPQITGTYAPNVYCVKITDVGNLFGPASFVIAIAHP